MESADLIELRKRDYLAYLKQMKNPTELASAYIAHQEERYAQAYSQKDWNKAHDSLFEIAAARLAMESL